MHTILLLCFPSPCYPGPDGPFSAMTSYCYWPEAVDDEALEHGMGEDFEPRHIRNWTSLLYEVWCLEFGIEIQRVL